jgi:hypothetical protein
MDTRRRSRRQLLAGLVAGVALAGCTGGSETSQGDDPSPEGGTAAPETADTAGGGTTGPSTSALDRREANVVGVAVDGTSGSVTVDVTLHHDDEGEDGYANWWQVERLDGTRLGRRDLLHAHAAQPFTRSGTVTVPPDVACVVVRGHDQTHGYGGVAVLVDLDTGATLAVDQGPEPRSFDESDCP